MDEHVMALDTKLAVMLLQELNNLDERETRLSNISHLTETGDKIPAELLESYRTACSVVAQNYFAKQRQDIVDKLNDLGVKV